MDPLIINAAITGMVPRHEDNPAVPVSVDEIVADAQRCASAGASILHVHARDQSGRPTWHAEVYERIINGIRAACPDILISASTSGRLWSDFNQRAAALDSCPDFGSLTPGSMNFPTGPSINSPEIVQQLARAMNERGVVPELEFFDLGMVDYVRDYLLPRGFLRPPLYANLMLGSLGTAAATPRNLVRLVEALPPGTTWSAAGIGRFQFPVNCLAIAMGGHVRVGLEDNLWMDPEKTDPATNVRLIQRVSRVAEAMDRPIATPAQTRLLIGLPTDHRLGRC
jgi:3-keto-5-aminohexanoate cleavage enzyme